jgi:hypothetical protein
MSPGLLSFASKLTNIFQNYWDLRPREVCSIVVCPICCEWINRDAVFYEEDMISPRICPIHYYYERQKFLQIVGRKGWMDSIVPKAPLWIPFETQILKLYDVGWTGLLHLFILDAYSSSIEAL